MNIEELSFELVKENETIPFELLQLADPSKKQIESYLNTGDCYLVKRDSNLVGVFVINEIDSASVEIKNIAIKESEQGKGFGKVLLQQAEKLCKELGNKKQIIGTGNSSIGQLALYQKSGFEMQSIKRDFFLENYSDPIFETGIQCKHMVVLEKIINL